MRSGISTAAVVGALLVMLSPRSSCSVKVTTPAPIEITISAINCRDGALASELSAALRSELSRNSTLTVNDSLPPRTSRLQLAAECVALESHLLIRVRLVDTASKGATISSYNALIKREELTEVVRQSIAKVASRAMEASTRPQIAKPATNSKSQVAIR